MSTSSRAGRSALHSPAPLPLLAFLLVLLLVAFLCPAAVVAQFTSISSSVKADYVFTNVSGVPNIGSAYVLTSTVFRSDEQPNLAVSLPFAFPYFGSLVTSVYLSPNGAVQLDNTLECCQACTTGSCCSFQNYALVTVTSTGLVPSCSFAINYYNLIAVMLTDLAPATAGSTVVYGYAQAAIANQTGNRTVWNPAYPFVIQYRMVPLATPLGGMTGAPGLLSPAGVSYTFGVGLYPSGQIDLYYWNVSDPALYDGWGDVRLWMVGLRQSAGQSQTNLYASEYADPNTGFPPSNGTYVPRNAVHNNQTWTFWPIGSSTCASPTHALTEGGGITRIALRDWANSSAAFTFTCLYIDDLGLVLSNVTAFYSITDDELWCVNPPALNDALVTIRLQANGVLLPIAPVHLQYINETSPYAPALEYEPDTFISLLLFCEQCAAFRPAVCWYDCAGTLHGSAVTDQCGMCVGGTTGRTYNQALDCLGVCYGPFTVVNGQCLCPNDGTSACVSLARSTLYLSDTVTQYIFSVNSTIMGGPDVLDTVISFDDTRYVQVPYGFNVLSSPILLSLPFQFPFFGSVWSYVYLSPMGAFYLSLPSAACQQHASILLYDGANDCTYQMIAGYLAEFDGQVPGYQYAFLETQDVFSVRFTNMHLSGSPAQTPLISFSITLYPTGRVLVQHHSIVPPSQVASVPGLTYTRRVLIGVMTLPRSSSDLQLVYPSPFLSSTLANGLFALAVENEWRPTTVSSGTFPTFSAVGRTGIVDFLPFSTNMCLAPYFGSANGGQLLHVNPSLVSPYIPYLNLSCVIAGEYYPALYNAVLDSYDCLVPAQSVVATVAVGLADDQANFLSMGRVYYEYYDPSAFLVQPTVYAEYYSTAQLCDQCYNSALSINTEYCYLDCNYEWRGQAYRDGCGSCVGGGTGNPPNVAKDCYGTCFGRYTMQAVSNYSQCSCPLVLPLSAAGSGCTIVPTIRPTPNVFTQYVDHFDQAQAPLAPVTVNASTIEVVVSSPVSPLTAITLPFTFSFFGTPVRQLYMDVDGAVYVTNTTLACMGNGSLSLFNALPTCLHQVIAGALTQHNTSTQPSFTSVLSYTVSSSRLDVRYGAGVDSFTMSLLSDSSISIAYDGVEDDGGDWLVGVRLGVPAQLMPFPYIVTAASYGQTCGAYTCVYTGLPSSYITPDQTAFLPHDTYTSGYYPQRALWVGPTSGVLTFCPLSIYFCVTPSSGPSRGGTLMSFVNNATLCDSPDCCARRMNMSCNFGFVTSPATFDLASNAWRCYTPQGTPNVVINVWLEESGRRIGTASPTFFIYNDTATQAVSQADVQQITCRDCGAILTSYCTKDCTGTYRGNATQDQCGVCKPPTNTTTVTTTNWVYTAANFRYTSALDCLGVCYGPFTTLNSTQLPSYAGTLPQCGCSGPSEPLSLRSLTAFPYTTLCAVWQKIDGGDALRSTIDDLKWYQVTVFVVAVLALVLAAVMEGVKAAKYVRKRMRMTPAERARERRRKERRRQRERDRRERRRRLALGLPLPDQEVLPPGVAAMPVPLLTPPSVPAPADGIGLRQRLVAAPAAEAQSPAAAVPPTSAPSTAAPARDAAAHVTTGPSLRNLWGGGGSSALSASESAALAQLHGMGFNDDAALLPLIRRCKGDVNSVINQLLR